jgi:hypothetical protein
VPHIIKPELQASPTISSGSWVLDAKTESTLCVRTRSRARNYRIATEASASIVGAEAFEMDDEEERRSTVLRVDESGCGVTEVEPIAISRRSSHGRWSPARA